VTAAARAFRSRVWVALAAVYLIWGSTYLAIHYAIETLPPLLMAGVRFLIAGTILYGWARWRGAARPTLRHWRSTAVVGALLLLGGNGGVVWAQKTVPSGLAALMVAIVPLWMVGISALRKGGERPGLRTWLGIGLGLCGVVILFGGGLAADRGYLLGGLLLLGASLAWSFGSIWSKTAALPESPLLATGMEMLCGGALLFVAGLLAKESGFDWQQVSAKSLWATAYLIVFGSLIGFTAYIWLLRSTTAALASTYAFVNPVVAVFLGWLLAGEAVTPRTLLAAAVIVTGVVVITLGRAHEKRAAVARDPDAARRATADGEVPVAVLAAQGCRD
jgi:drug/metabolite transporter (DMT)-like permease